MTQLARKYLDNYSTKLVAQLRSYNFLQFQLIKNLPVTKRKSQTDAGLDFMKLKIANSKRQPLE